MFQPLHFLFSIFLSLSIILSGAPFHTVFKAYAEEVPGSGEEVSDAEAEAEKDQIVGELVDAFLDPSKGEAALDPFQLVRQAVIDDRDVRVQAVIDEERRVDYRERVKHLQDKLTSLKELRAEAREKLDALPAPVDGASEDKRAQFELILSDIEDRIKLTLLEIEDLPQFDPEKGKPLPIDHMVDQDIPKNHYWGRRMGIEVPTANGDSVLVRQRSFTQSLSHFFSKENPLAGVTTSDEKGFLIQDNRGNILHEFFKPVEAVFFYGEYLVYIEKEAMERIGETKTLPVRMIDLQTFRSNIGNSPLPVFTLPLNMEEAPTSIKIEKGRLKVGETALSYPQFSVMSRTQRLIFNVNAALVDPDAAKNSQPLAREILSYFSKSMDQQGQIFEQNLEKAMRAKGWVEDLAGAFEQRPQYQADEVKLQIEKALSDGTITNDEHAQLSKVLQMDSSVAQANDGARQGRRLFTRMSLLWRHLMQPRPEGAPRLLQALMMTAFSEGRARLVDIGANDVAKKFLRYGGGAMAAFLVSTQLPEPYTLNLYKGLDLINATYQHYMGYLQHMEFGKAFGILSKDAFVTTTTGWTYAFEAYISDGKWVKVLYGVATVLMIPLGAFASIHMFFNSLKM